VTPDFAPDAFARLLVRMSEFTDYLRALFVERRASPADDLVTALLEAEEAGDSLSEPELFSMVVLRGDSVIVLINAANHDSARFASPEDFSLDRPTTATSPSVAALTTA